MNLVTHLARRAELHPDRIALIDAERAVSYAELYKLVCSGSDQLRHDGLSPGDTVLILQAVSIPLYISLLSAFHSGLTVMFIDPSAGKTMIRNSLSLHQAQAFIGTGKAHLLRITIPEIRQIPKHYHSSGWVPSSKAWKPTSSTPSTPVDTAPDTPALITFTSGSTGMPKAACRTHGFLLAQHRALAASLDLQDGEVDLITLPVFALANLASGLTSVIAHTDLRYPARVDSQAVFDQCNKHNVTRCAASPAFFTQLHRDRMMPAFASIYTGGAPVFPDLLSEIQSAHPGMQVVTVFGSTEAEPIAHIRWQDTSEHDRNQMVSGKGLLVGHPVSATQLRIIPDQSGKEIGPMDEAAFNALELPHGKIGEIVVTGDHVLKGYLHGQGNEESKIHVLSDHSTVWHRTGDAAWRDQSGRVWLMGRCSAAINSPGQSPIYPFGIECAATNFPSVRRCALLMHQGRVTLVVEGEFTHKQQEALQSQLPHSPVEAFLNVTHIPVDKRHNAKIDYPELRKSLKK
ncbi:AMP-binding protein [Verrucomicrobiaceae bacterium N1E253]|uniref:AMP-binding protein n=1 Tax=Oceaniferula marina TaxID=2748318 RepID=A0A851GG69_9BACT|nr:AMP-binding protein [Oceaniferula marina]NWK54157.1 AMP-binding protein [Oceaniferula marina]